MAKFRATKDQVSHLLALASNASAPMGMGFLHYDPGTKFEAKDFPRPEYGTDYVQGRMVKCSPLEVGEGMYELNEPAHDYQSWITTYPTAKDLIEAAGLKVEEEPTPQQEVR